LTLIKPYDWNVFERIAEIDTKILGQSRQDYWEMIDHLKKVDVDTIYTFVNWRDWRLLKFFNTIGFTTGDMVSLKMDV